MTTTSTTSSGGGTLDENHQIFGAIVDKAPEGMHLTAPNGLHGKKLELPYPSVGATEQVLLTAVLELAGGGVRHGHGARGRRRGAVSSAMASFSPFRPHRDICPAGHARYTAARRKASTITSRRFAPRISSSPPTT